MSDIIERLRSWDNPATNEAAAEIERLRADITVKARFEDDCEKLRTLLAEACTRNAELLAALHSMIDEWEKLSRYGSPMAKAANPRVNAARAAIAANVHAARQP